MFFPKIIQRCRGKHLTHYVKNPQRMSAEVRLYKPRGKYPKSEYPTGMADTTLFSEKK